MYWLKKSGTASAKESHALQIITFFFFFFEKSEAGGQEECSQYNIKRSLK